MVQAPLTPLASAYLGDAVIEIFVREALVGTGVSDTGKLSEASRAFVRADAQSAAVGRLLNSGELTEEETAVYRRGRNAHVSGCPKRQSAADYHRATGFECLMGWLYSDGQTPRCRQLFAFAYAEQLQILREKPLN